MLKPSEAAALREWLGRDRWPMVYGALFGLTVYGLPLGLLIGLTTN